MPIIRKLKYNREKHAHYTEMNIKQLYQRIKMVETG